MGNIMYFSFGMNKGYARYFWIYRILSFYPYMILITIFATRKEIDAPQIPNPYTRRDIMLNTNTGLSILIYTWIAGYIWPYVFWCIAMNAIDSELFSEHYRAEASRYPSTYRDLITYVENLQFTEAQQLLRFGYIVKKDYKVDFINEFVKYFVSNLFSLSLLHHSLINFDKFDVSCG